MLNSSHPQIEKPLVSVVIPTYNRPQLLKEALASVVAQTYTNLQILVMNNASDEETSKLIAEFPDPRIEHHRHATNIGMTPNVQAGFLASKGKYVTNLHDDDYWAPDFVDKMVTVLESNSSAILAFSDQYIIDHEGKVNLDATSRNQHHFYRAKLATGYYQPFQRLAIVEFAIPICNCAVFRRESMDWADFANLPSAYDFWLAYLACREGAGCYYLDEKLSYYRYHAANESTAGRIRFNDGCIEVYRRMLEDPSLKEYRSIFIPRYADHYRDAAIALLRSGERKKAHKYLKQAISIHPRLKTILTYLASYLPNLITSHLPPNIRFK